MRYQHADFDEALATVADGAELETEGAVATGTDAIAAGAAASQASRVRQVQRFGEKVGRNDPCPCGSGKKYKNCHGKLA